MIATIAMMIAANPPIVSTNTIDTTKMISANINSIKV